MRRWIVWCLVVVVAVAGCRTGGPAVRPAPSGRTSSTPAHHASSTGPTAVDENAKPGTTGLTSTEVDRAYPIAGTPGDLQVVAHSPVSCGPRLHTFSDATYHTVPSGAGVFATGSMEWVPALRGPDSRSTTVAFARTVTLNLIQAMATAPLGRRHPAHPDLATLGASSSTSTGTGGTIG
ncbi:N,N-dimethylformamidase beta subunit family domain-containing protein [Kribbella sp. NPDC049584]|uniref:N,N-dimethylformamidase beta subunit family domain-containing protein n=1 Tax=Kribbella sp. NPDC049584 TaxID=3154833 RepID=UPI0034178BE7